MKHYSVYNLYTKEEIEDDSQDCGIVCYSPLNKSSDTAIIIFAGGGYAERVDHEGIGYAEFFSSNGITAFVVNYRVKPNYFPKPLIDGRTAIKFVRSKAKEFEIDKNKILVMGSSAGGHLASLLSTYFDKVEGDDYYNEEDFIPNGQILCYSVLSSDKNFGHIASYVNLLGDKMDIIDSLSPEKIASSKTPKAFIFHTFSDEIVNVKNAICYAEKLNRLNIDCELHIFPNGAHGVGLSNHIENVSQWKTLLLNWLKHNNFL